MESTDDVITFRIKRSDEAFAEAMLLAHTEHYNTAINRLYYAAFYAVSALLLKDGIYSKTHSGLISKFHEHLIKEKKLPADSGRVYKELFDLRQDGDYGDFIVYTTGDFKPLVDKTQKLINEIKKLI